MSYIKINGREFDADVAIMKYTRNLNVVDGPNAGRVISGRMVRDVIGAYLGRKVTVAELAAEYELEEEKIREALRLSGDRIDGIDIQSRSV